MSKSIFICAAIELLVIIVIIIIATLIGWPATTHDAHNTDTKTISKKRALKRARLSLTFFFSFIFLFL